MRWAAAALTDVGRKRRGNEDAFLLRPEHAVFAVADGMGGHAAGEVASRIAVETVAEALTGKPAKAAVAPPLEELERVVTDANRAIYERAAAQPAEAGMGTTLTVVALAPRAREYRVAHVGDSRAYLLRAGELRQLTNDHTWVQEQVEQGLLTPRQARAHPASSVLTRALGTGLDVDVDLLTGTFEAGDLLLVCSDGLTGMVGDEDLREMLDRELPLETLAEQLIEAANARGGWDNITAVLIRAEG